ncbi:carboxymuconolactone decarboxylase family protein [Roseomonas sp. E05]|uniref:carboxymuconolactone decarboxylase family protein n=1 Tax=Roseomonas sp. E05 TaxID=3046310 RepID=UPI0024BA91E7|nr:carboxymuconolactone decarboxylase family protein [Roseomonas sp. E05]MDJ0387695.1 carboxymuconolactone decarboxylase family protein [Roseomonas sp. E05]
MSRLPSIDPETLSPAQSEVYNRIATGARGGVRGPFLALLHSPGLAARVEQLGVYVRFQCAVPERLRELAILTVATHWRCDYEWYAHAPLAERLGLPEAVLAQLGRGEAPDFEEPNDALVRDYCATLLREGRVPDTLYNRAREALGQQGIVDLTGLVGYYTLLALTLNGHEVAAPGDAQLPWRTA